MSRGTFASLGLINRLLGTTFSPGSGEIGTGALVRQTSPALITPTVTGSFLLNANAAALPAGPTGTIFQIGQADAIGNVALMDSFGAGPQFVFRRAGGTNASKSGVTAGSNLGLITAYGYGATGYSAASRASITFVTAEAGTWTDAVQGASILFNATLAGGTTTAEAFRVTGSGVIVTGTFQGSGNIKTTAGTVNYLGTTTGAADAMAITAAPAITAYTTGAIYYVMANAANATTTPTIDINALGAKTLVKRVNTALAANDYLANMFIMLQYDGTNMVLLNPVVN